MKRHDLVILNSDGRKYAADIAVRNHQSLNESFIHQIIAGERIPGIIKRQENSSVDQIEIGFSTRYYQPDGGRIRLNSVVPRKQIAAMLSPFEVLLMASDTEPYEELQKSAANCKIEVGLYGSSAMEVVTGQKYRNERSDIDIYIRCREKSGGDLRDFWETVQVIADECLVSFDVEIEYQETYGIKLTELLSNQKTVLAKGLYDVQLFDRKAVLEELTWK